MLIHSVEWNAIPSARMCCEKEYFFKIRIPTELFALCPVELPDVLARRDVKAGNNDVRIIP